MPLNSVRVSVLPIMLLAFCSILLADNGCNERKLLTFGMPPAVSADLADIWSSRIRHKVEEQACIKLRFRSAKDFKQYILKAKAGKFDLIAAPAHISSYLIKSEGFNPVIFLIWESSYLYVTKEDSVLQHLDLKTPKIYSLPDPLSEASILAQFEIKTQFNQPNSSFNFHQHHMQIVKSVMSEQADIGVVLSPFYKAYQLRKGHNLKVIHSTPFPSHGMLIASPNVSVKEQEEFFQVFSRLEPVDMLFWKSLKKVTAKDLVVFHKKQNVAVNYLESTLDAN